MPDLADSAKPTRRPAPVSSASMRCDYNRLSASTAAAQSGRFGRREIKGNPILRDGGLREFCRLFNRRFEALAETKRPEWREFAHQERRDRLARG